MQRLLARRMHVHALPMRWGFGDNYSYLFVDDKTGESAIVDPAQPEEVLPKLKQLEKDGHRLTTIINTHHHFDHSDGNAVFRELYPKLPLVAGKDSPLVTETPADGSTFKIGKNIVVRAVHTPCHTQDSICYYVVDEDTGEKAVFTGDTLFTAGCGRFFEGTAKEMDAALSKLGKLPGETKVYPGHEYTLGNAKFAKTVMDVPAVTSLLAYCQKNKYTTGRFSIADEQEHNPFMRVDDPALQDSLGVKDRTAAMAKLRELKNNA